MKNLTTLAAAVLLFAFGACSEAQPQNPDTPANGTQANGAEANGAEAAMTRVRLELPGMD